MSAIDSILAVGILRPELTIGILGIAALAAAGIWALFRWYFSGPVSPDPWGDAVSAELAREDATPLCHRCLTEVDGSQYFCHKCGAAVGAYTNWLPYPYLFSVGHGLRIGSAGEFRRSPFTVAGFLLFGFAEYSIFAPIYWYVFLKKLLVGRTRAPGPDAQPPVSNPG